MQEDYQAEDVLDRPYDWRLMKRLLEYAKPYWSIIAVCVVLIIASAFFDVALPYLTKMAIDRHIAVSSKKITVPDEAFGARILGKYHTLLVPVSKTEFMIDTALTNRLESDDLKALTDSKMLSEERFYVILRSDYLAAKWEQIRSLCERNGLVGFESGFYMETDVLKKLPRQELATLCGRDIRGLMTLGMLFLSVLVLNFAVSYGQVYLMQYSSQRLLFDMRLSRFDHMQRLPLSFFDRTPVGRLVTRATNDFATINEMFTAVLVNLVKDLLLLVIIAGVMLHMSWQLAVAAFVVIPPVLYTSILFRKKARGAYRKIRVKIARMNASFNEFISGISVIRAFCQEGRIDRRFRDISHDVFLWRKKQITIFAIFRPAMWVLSYSATAIIIWYGGGKVLQNVVSLGVFVAFLNYIDMFFRPIHDLAEKYNIIQAAMASSERIFQLMDKVEEPNVAQLPEKPTPRKTSVEFKNVWFAYNDNDWVLKDVSFDVRPGETVAVVGPTGGGKTTMTSLLSRLYPIQKGEILVDETNIAQLPLEKLRKMVGVVQQDVFLFSTTVGGNIRLNSKEIDRAMLERSAKIARADRLISRLSNGFDEPVVERGATFSAGEKQLLSFARVLSFDPEILVLDEATSNIDPETESLIQQALIDLTKGRTCLIVAHRLSTIEHADRILVLHKGRLREQGTHQELLAKRGIYYDLYRLQYV